MPIELDDLEGLFEFFGDVFDDLFDGLAKKQMHPPDPAMAADLGEVLAALGLPRTKRESVEVTIEGRPVGLRETVEEDRWLLGLRMPLQFELDGNSVAWGWNGATISKERKTLFGRRKNPEREELFAVLRHSSVKKRLETLYSNGCRIVLHSDHLDIGVMRANRKAKKVARDIKAAVKLGKALEGVALRPWRALAKSYGLKVDGFWLSGTVSDVPINVRFLRNPDPGTHIVVGVQPTLPQATWIARKVDEPEPIGDPILDRVVQIETSDAAALSKRVVRDEIRGPLLDWVAERGGVVRSDRVELVLSGLVREELGAPITAAVELAGLLR